MEMYRSKSVGKAQMSHVCLVSCLLFVQNELVHDYFSCEEDQ